MLVGILIGFVIGAGVVYWFLQTKIQKQQKELNQAQKTIDEQERSYGSRLKEMIQSLKADHQRELEQTATQYQAQYQTRIRDLESRLSSANTTPPEPTQGAAILAQLEAEFSEPTTPPAPIEPAQPVLAPLPDPWEATAELTIEPPIEPIPEPTIEPIADAEDPTAEPITLTEAPSSEPIAPDASLTITPEPSKPVLLITKPVSQAYLSQISYDTYSPDVETRKAAATALGTLAAANPRRPDAQSAIALLQKLSRDSHASVRQAAVTALGTIASPKVVPALKAALRDTDLAVVRVATEAMAKFKLYSTSSKPTAAKSKAKPGKR